MTMYEVLGWIEPYPKNKFKYPWQIADFVVTGKRLPIVSEMADDEYSIIEKSWKDGIRERLSMNEITAFLETKYMMYSLDTFFD